MMKFFYMIPKIIHQTAKTEVIPNNWKDYQRKVISLHPEWKYILWTDKDNDKFVKEEFPEFYKIYFNMPKNIMRADVIRYLLMYKVGGLYLDLDYEFLRPFDLIDRPLVLPMNRSARSGDVSDSFGNSIFASEPKHVFWEKVINYLFLYPPIKDENYDVENVTGPGLLTKVYYMEKENIINIDTPDRMLFHPPNPKTYKEYRRLKEEVKSYGIHHCEGTWRDMSISVKIKTKIKKLVYQISCISKF